MHNREIMIQKKRQMLVAVTVFFLASGMTSAQIREYRIHDRGMLHETVFNTGEIGRAWQTGEAGNVSNVPLMEWPPRSATVVLGNEYSGQHNIIGAGVYIGANLDGSPGKENRLFALCGAVGASTPEVAFGRWSFPLNMEEIENFPVLPNGELNPDYDPNEAEEIIKTSWATPTGITVSRTSRAWSYPDYDDMIIYEYTFEYTGDTDGNAATIEQTTKLNDVMIAFQYGFAPSMYGYQRIYQTWKYEGGMYRGDQNGFWDADYWLAFNMNLKTDISDATRFAKPEPDTALFRLYSRTGMNGGGLCSPQAPGYCMLYYDTTHLAVVIPDDPVYQSMANLNESEAQALLKSYTAPGTTTKWWYEIDNAYHVKQPWSNKISTGNTNSQKMMYEMDAFNPAKRWSGVYSPASTSWPVLPSDRWIGRGAYPYKQSADAAQKHIVFGPYTMEVGDKLQFSLAEVIGYGGQPGKNVEGGQVTTQWAATPTWNRNVAKDGVSLTDGQGYLDRYGYPDYVNSDSIITVTDVARKAFEAYIGTPPVIPVWPEDNPRVGNYQIPTPVPAPVITVANTVDGEVRIKWGRAVEAFTHPRLTGTLQQFNVYRSNAGMGPWEQIGKKDIGEVNTENLYEFVDADTVFKVGEKKYYAVTSLDDQGFESGKTNITFFKKNIGSVTKLHKVYVVPNPFIVRSGFAGAQDESVLGFYGLPEKCTIRIFSYAGQLVDTIVHDEPVYSHEKPQVTRNGQEMASGVYFYVVSTPGGDETSGKFIVIK